MNEPDKEPQAAQVEVAVELDEKELAQVDALIEQYSTPSHRLTREEMLRMLVEKGQEQVEGGEDLLPYLDGEQEPESVP